MKTCEDTILTGCQFETGINETRMSVTRKQDQLKQIFIRNFCVTFEFISKVMPTCYETPCILKQNTSVYLLIRS